MRRHWAIGGTHDVHKLKLVWRADAPAAATLTEIRTAARTTKSDPGRRKRLHPGRRDASKATGSTPTPESRQSTATRLSDMDSRPSATASRTSARASQDAGAWTLPVAADGDSAAPEGQRRSDGASSTRAAGRPNSRSALDLPGQVFTLSSRFTLLKSHSELQFSTAACK